MKTQPRKRRNETQKPETEQNKTKKTPKLAAFIALLLTMGKKLSRPDMVDENNVSKLYII